MRIHFIKKGILLATAALGITTLYVSPSYADDPGADYLRVIAQNTTNMLVKLNNVPDYISSMLQYIVNMQKTDDSASTSEMQANFATIGTLFSKDYTMQQGIQEQINADLLGATSEKNPSRDEVLYSALLTSYDANNPNSKALFANAYRYMRNASGIGLIAQQPRRDKMGLAADTYKAYYDSITSVKSFNAYVLSNRLTEMLNGNGLSPAQAALAVQASNSNWIAQIATEEIGKVLRQLLVFQSQTYVLLSEMVQTQKQMLMAQAMTNTLLIATSKSTQDNLYQASTTSR